jgi:hypothetical protein
MYNSVQMNNFDYLNVFKFMQHLDFGDEIFIYFDYMNTCTPCHDFFLYHYRKRGYQSHETIIKLVQEKYISRKCTNDLASNICR